MIAVLPPPRDDDPCPCLRRVPSVLRVPRSAMCREFVSNTKPPPARATMAAVWWLLRTNLS